MPPRSVLVLVLAVVPSIARAADPPVDFARDVLPVLSDACFHCHGPDAGARKADLRLDTKDGVLGGDSPAVVPGKSGASELIRRLVTADPDEAMPPPKSKKKPLTPAQVATLKRWVDQGAQWGRHWSLEPPVRPAVPTVPPVASAPARNPIDHFIQRRLSAEKLTPAPEAPRGTLLRRVTLDLTGLPPTPEELDAFLADRSPDAYEKVVDRLLASPRYGERMVWDWLDAARYADSNGYQGDGERTMWPWRDWAAAALNADLPFDRFTVEQVAGDLLPNATRDQKLATGFLRNHMINGEGGRIAEENRVDYVMDMTETVGTVWLGLTFNCCRCHDHKYDPVAQREYYGLFAFFNQTPVTGGGGDPQTKPVVEIARPDDEARLKDLTAMVTAGAAVLAAVEAERPAAKDLPKEVADALKAAPATRSKAQYSALEKHFAKPDPKYAARLKAQRELLESRDAASKAVVRVMVMEDMPKPRDTFVLTKGLYTKPADKVTAGVPAALPPLPTGAKRDRLALANWLVSPGHPLTARVTVNRLWQQFFGVGLVKTAEDFGVQGERPVHPELLDWLAVEFPAPTAASARPWSVKHVVRLMVTSHAYRQSSKVTPALVERDPENRFLARGSRHRLPSWMIRDQALAASGLLVDAVGGPPVRPYQPAGVWEEATFGTKRYAQDHGPALYRRSLYTFWRRIVGPTMFFDTAARQTCSVKQARTNTPLHALATLNDVTYVEAARALAERTLTAGGPDDGVRLRFLFRRVLARAPTDAEAKVLTAGLARTRAQYSADPDAAKRLLAVGESKRDETLSAAEHAAWTAVALTVLNTDEALSKE